MKISVICRQCRRVYTVSDLRENCTCGDGGGEVIALSRGPFAEAGWLRQQHGISWPRALFIAIRRYWWQRQCIKIRQNRKPGIE